MKHLITLLILGIVSFCQLQAQNTITGIVYSDLNGDCLQQFTEEGRLYYRIEAVNTADNQVYAGITDFSGNYAINVPSGNYNISLIANNPLLSSFCNTANTVTFGGVGGNQTADFGLSYTHDCPVLTVDIETAQLLRCSTTPPYVVSYCNIGTDTALNAYIDVVLDAAMRYDSSSVPMTLQGNNTYRRTFTGGIGTNVCNSFLVYVSLDTACNSTLLNQTHCTEARIYPNESDCLGLLWQGALAKPTASCQTDSVAFKVINEGLTGMPTPLGYTIIEDNAILRTGNYQLPFASDSIIIKVPANGTSMYRIEVEQDTTVSSPVILDRMYWAFIEGCNNTGTFNTGFATQYYTGDSRYSIDIDCRMNESALDSNHLYASPLGFDSIHCVDARDAIDYAIYLNNLDSAYSFYGIEIWDTLSPYLDPRSIEWGANRYYAEKEWLPNNVLHWVLPFNGVQPAVYYPKDASAFVSFSILPYAGLPEGTIIDNKVRVSYIHANNGATITTTDSSRHRICSNFVPFVVISAQVYNHGYELQVYPNPFEQSVVFECDNHPFEQLHLEVYDVAGKMIRTQQESGNRLFFERGDLPSGVYLYKLYGDGQPLGAGKMVAY